MSQTRARNTLRTLNTRDLRPKFRPSNGLLDAAYELRIEWGPWECPVSPSCVRSANYADNCENEAT